MKAKFTQINPTEIVLEIPADNLINGTGEYMVRRFILIADCIWEKMPFHLVMAGSRAAEPIGPKLDRIEGENLRAREGTFLAVLRHEKKRKVSSLRTPGNTPWDYSGLNPDKFKDGE